MKIKQNLWVVLVVIAIAVITRLIPHYPNFTALGAAALFSGAFLRSKFAILIPLIALFISDLLLNNLIYAQQLPHNYNGFVILEPQTLWSYGAFVIIALLGMRLIRTGKIFSVIGTSFLSSVIFFLITNFAVWLGSTIYPQSLAGLGATYLVGIPFFWNTVAGDLFFVAVFFGSFEFVRGYLPQAQRRTV